MNVNKIRILLIGLIVFGLAACGQVPDNEPVIEPPASTQIEVTNDEPALNQPEPTVEESVEVASEADEGLDTVSGLSAEEIDGLGFMREEEKLARDVYNYLYELWGQQIFANIAKSEQTHTDAVLNLLNQYGLDDPAAGLAQGEFQDPELQQLYDDLVQMGGESLADALEVGAIIEEVDILDLEERIAQTVEEDILVVYQNLLRGSENHLRAFVKNLERKAAVQYEPHYLDMTSYQDIVP